MIYIIGGQTASGKSSLALSFAKEIGGQIVNADAFQIYRKLDIGTAKPTLNEQSVVKHHLFDIVNIDEPFSIFEYQKVARSLINGLIKKNIPVIIVGGSALYIRSVLYDYKFSQNVEVDMEKYEQLTNEQLHDELNIVDKYSAKVIHPNNRRRVLRALQIYLSTGIAKSENEKKQSKEPIYPYVMVALKHSKEDLSDLIKQRVIVMFNNGFVHEANTLGKIYPLKSPGFKAIGYEDIITNNDKTDEELIQIISDKTIKYAKRQLTFFKNKFDITFVETKEQALELLKSKYGENTNEKH